MTMVSKKVQDLKPGDRISLFGRTVKVDLVDVKKPEAFTFQMRNVSVSYTCDSIRGVTFFNEDDLVEVESS